MPMNLKLYPPDWKAISLKIRARAKQKCECRGECGHDHEGHGGRCNAPNYVEVWRDGAEWWNLDSFPETDAKMVETFAEAITYMRRKVKVILTVAHLNHTPSDCRPKNLKAMCQFCHLNYDAKHHAINAAATRRKKKLDAGQLEMI